MIQNLTLIRSVLRKLFVTCVILAFVHVSAFAQPTTTISVSPNTQAVGLNQTFVVALRVDIATTGVITGTQIALDFDRTKLSVESIAKPVSALFSLESTPLQTIASINTSGQITYAAGIPSGTTNVDFNFLEITFRSLASAAAGSTPLTFINTFPRLTRAINGGSPVSAPPISGSVNIVTCTPPTATISNTLTCNGQTFNLRLAGATGVSPFDLTINGQTYNDVTVGANITSFTPPSNNIFTNPNPVSNDEVDGTGPVTLGVKFQSSVTGYVKGVRFFTHASPAGTYRAQLWASTGGAPLATATFSGVTGNAWNQVLFTSPVLIAANTTYIVSYHTSASTYTATSGGLNSNVTNASLTAPSGGTSGGNGVYAYGASPTFPANSFGNANYWADVVFTPASYSFQVTGINDGGGCAVTGAPLSTLNVLSADCSTLPVTLLNLSATPKSNDVLLQWSTASEIDNKGFEVQRSVPGGPWEGLTFVHGAGNSNSLINYSYTDRDLFPRVYNYRLRQEDIDGKYKFSMIVSVSLTGNAESRLGQNYPNPFKNETTIQFTLAQREKVTLTIFDMNGRVVKTLINNVSKDKGTHAVNFFSNALPPGMYYYTLNTEGYTQTKKMVLQ
jgi:hypothetical protein